MVLELRTPGPNPVLSLLLSQVRPIQVPRFAPLMSDCVDLRSLCLVLRVHAGDPPPAWGIEVVPEPFAVGPLRFCHHPDCVADGYVIAGHLHPAIILRGRANERVRLACYWFGELVGVLPAFGSFAGSAIISPAAGDRVFGIAGDSVVAIPVDSPAVGSVGGPRRVAR